MKQDMLNSLRLLESQTSELNVIQLLKLLALEFPGAVTFSTSFSNEDQVITDYIAQSQADISVFTLDTGRLFETTYEVWEKSKNFFGLSIKAYYPMPDAISSFTEQNGPNAFYRSVELRKECCNIRKIIPLKKALLGKSIWITGLRAEHSIDRSNTNQFEWDEQNNVIKYHPLLKWTTNEVTAYIKKYDIPYNPLTDRGFVSIGCEPCTRAIKAGEDFRAGRWWWEASEKKECGLHLRSYKNTNTNTEN